jgi:deoxycytidylate deaminase
MYKSPKPFPFIPEGRTVIYVPIDNPFMRQAAEMIKHAGCAKHPVAAVLVKDGQVIGRGANGSMRSDQRHSVCKRIELKCLTGTGYEHCPNCVTPGHSESTVIKDAREQGHDLAGADIYLFGHWWCCEPCWDKMVEAGVREVYLLEKATELFDRPEGTVEVLREMGIEL